MAVTPQRQEELIDALFSLDDAEFDRWLEQQPDKDELAKEALDLMQSEPNLDQIKQKQDQAMAQAKEQAKDGAK